VSLSRGGTALKASIDLGSRACTAEPIRGGVFGARGRRRPALAAGLGSAGRGTLIGRVLSMGGDQIMPRQQRLFERNFPVVIAALPQQSIYLWVLLDEPLVCT
jgi:hypothetical protein